MMLPVGSVIYVSAERSWFSVRNLKNGQHFESAVNVAYVEKKGKPHKVIAVGGEQLSSKIDAQVRYTDGFDHPRVWVSSADIASLTFSFFIRKVTKHRYALKPVILFHPLFAPEDGWSEFELRSIATLWQRAGARKVMVCTEPGPFPPELVVERLDTFVEYKGFLFERK